MLRKSDAAKLRVTAASRIIQPCAGSGPSGCVIQNGDPLLVVHPVVVHLARLGDHVGDAVEPHVRISGQGHIIGGCGESLGGDGHPEHRRCVPLRTVPVHPAASPALVRGDAAREQVEPARAFHVLQRRLPHAVVPFDRELHR